MHIGIGPICWRNSGNDIRELENYCREIRGGIMGLFEADLLREKVFIEMCFYLNVDGILSVLH